jgi:hypothetical protein
VGWLQSIVGLFRSPPPPVTAEAVAAKGDAATEASPRPRGRWLRVLLWALHVLVVVGILVGLWYLEQRLDLGRALRSRAPTLHPIWLPLLFLVFYALCWLSWWLWRLLGPERPSGSFTDIEDAWTDALAELKTAGIGLTDAPLFLVLGRAAAPFEQFFASSRLALQVRHSPGPDAPLHVYANREAIFVTCEGTSLLGKQAALLTAQQAEERPPVELVGAAAEAAPAEAGATAQPEAQPRPGPAPGPTTVLLLGEEDVGPRPAAKRPSLLKDEVEVQRQAARLRHLCLLLVRDRHPYCPANGVLVVLPLAATDSANEASETGSVCRHDLAAAREALGVDCPRLVVLADMEKVTGFSDLAWHQLGGRSNGQAAGPSWVVGRHFPLAPDLGPAQAEWPLMVESGLAWLAESLLPLVVYKLLGPDADLSSNGRLFMLLQDGRERLRNLARLVGRGLRLDGDDRPLLGGCYLAATGADAERDQAFLTGVLRRAIDNQNYVVWTADALAEDADYRRWTLLGYLGLAVFVAALAALVWSWFRS